MVEFTLPSDRFKQQVRESLKNQPLGWRTVKYSKSQYIYTPGARDGMIYYIESGQVKLLLPSYDGKLCLTSIRTSGDIFGESCLSGQSVRLEMAVAMKELSLRKISAHEFVATMKSNALLESLIQYLATRISEQLEVIGALTTENSEHRLAKTLLHLGRLLGTGDSHTVRIQQRISHEELSTIVGTTRPRIGIFLKKFRQLGLVGVTDDGFLVIEPEKMRQYLRQDSEANDVRITESAASPANLYSGIAGD